MESKAMEVDKGVNKSEPRGLPSLIAHHFFTMIIRVYSLCVMMLDLGQLLISCTFSLFEAVMQFFMPAQMKELTDELAVVIGASRGVGRELALQLSELNVKVVCVDINTSGNEATKKDIVRRGGHAHAYTCDITSRDMVQKMVNSIEENVGAITMLFHCCGLPSPRSLLTDVPSIHSTLDVTVVSHFWLLEEILPKMKKRKNGHLVLLSSVAGLNGIKKQTPLSVAQFAVQGLFESVIEDIRISKMYGYVNATLCHVYPFIVSDDLASDIRLRIPSFLGTISAKQAASDIIAGVRRNKIEFSIPWYLLFISHFMKLLPRKTVFIFRNILDTGVEF